MSDTRYTLRNENVLIVSWNTIRLMDVPVIRMIDDILGIKTHPIIEVTRAIERKTPHISYRGMTEEEYYNTIATLFPKAYAQCPYTELRTILMSSTVGGINSTTVAHNTFGGLIDVDSEYMFEPEMTNIVFDGTIEGLEEIIIDRNITAIIVDDIEYLRSIIDRGIVDVRGKTFIFPVIGYNMTISNGELVYKYEDRLIVESDELGFEYAFINVFNIPEDLMKTAIIETLKANGPDYKTKSLREEK